MGVCRGRIRSRWVRRTLTGLCVAVVIGGCGGEKWPLSASPAPLTGTSTTTITITEPSSAGGNTAATLPAGGEGYTEEEIAAGNQAFFDDARAALEATFRAQPDPKLTALSFDVPLNEVIVAFVYRDRTGIHRSRDDGFAWQTAQTLSDSFWFPELVQTFPSHHADPAWLPQLRIQIDDVVYQCPALVQIAVAARHFTQRDWLARCRA
jgi:hypothetical protein